MQESVIGMDRSAAPLTYCARLNSPAFRSILCQAPTSHHAGVRLRAHGRHAHGQRQRVAAGAECSPRGALESAGDGDIIAGDLAHPGVVAREGASRGGAGEPERVGDLGDLLARGRAQEPGGHVAGERSRRAASQCSPSSMRRPWKRTVRKTNAWTSRMPSATTAAKASMKRSTSNRVSNTARLAMPRFVMSQSAPGWSSRGGCIEWDLHSLGCLGTAKVTAASRIHSPSGQGGAWGEVERNTGRLR